ncbi:hypothetical protein CC79DRAFT_1328075 [Sarocladium strictum]
MASKALIPRFLLPLRGPLWRGVHIPLSQTTVCVRFASTKDKPIVLEKPLKFNPPSHGSRLKRNATPKHYGPILTSTERGQQDKKHYPGMMAPQGTWSHWIWHSRIFHTCITLGTLFCLGIFTFFMNYAFNSPYKALVPPISDLWNRPTYFFVAWKEVITLHEKDKAQKAIDHRNASLDDHAKRQYFMKMHGIEAKDPVTMIFGKGKDDPVDAVEGESSNSPMAAVVEQAEPEQKKKRFGIF